MRLAHDSLQPSVRRDGRTVDGNVAASHARVATDVIDIVHLHSCDRDTLSHRGVIDALAAATQAGRVRVAAYSGVADALMYTLGDRRIGRVQCSVNPCDQEALNWLGAEKCRRIGVLAKRPFAGLPWPADDELRAVRDVFTAVGATWRGII